MLHLLFCPVESFEAAFDFWLSHLSSSCFGLNLSASFVATNQWLLSVISVCTSSNSLTDLVELNKNGRHLSRLCINSSYWFNVSSSLLGGPFFSTHLHTRRLTNTQTQTHTHRRKVGDCWHERATVLTHWSSNHFWNLLRMPSRHYHSQDSSTTCYTLCIHTSELLRISEFTCLN